MRLGRGVVVTIDLDPTIGRKRNPWRGLLYPSLAPGKSGPLRKKKSVLSMQPWPRS